MSDAAERRNGDDLERVYTWIDQIPLSRAKRCMARDFSDGVLMAELLKRYYPRLVDIHNYVPANSVAKKIDNWCTLNRKVLSKLDAKLNKETIDRLANSQNGTIERVLIDLRGKISRDCATQDSPFAEFEELGKRELDECARNSSETDGKVIPRHVFLRLKRELVESNETIEKLREKVRHLEDLIKLKDERISDLMARGNKSLNLS